MSWLNETQELKYSQSFSSDEEDTPSKPDESNDVILDLAETQELEYPSSNNSDSELTSEDESSISDESQPDYSNLKGYDFEPECDPRPVSPSSDEGANTEDRNDSRVGNRDWCVCGKCEAMKSATESLCCKDTNEVPEEFYEGMHLKLIV